MSAPIQHVATYACGCEVAFVEGEEHTLDHECPDHGATFQGVGVDGE